MDLGEGYVEVREPRTLVGKFCKLALILWTLFCGFSMIQTVLRASDVMERTSGLAAAVGASHAVNLLLQDFIIFLLGLVVLGGATLATRGRKRLIPLAQARAGEGSQPPRVPVSDEESWRRSSSRSKRSGFW